MLEPVNPKEIKTVDKMPETAKSRVLESLKPLFDNAIKNKLFFFNPMRTMILSPRQLREAQSQGNCLWSADNWSLIDPKQYIAKLKVEVAEKTKIIKDYEGGLSI